MKLIAVLLIFYSALTCQAEAYKDNNTFAPFGLSQGGYPIHPSSLTNEFGYVGEWWGDPDFAIEKFAGLEFGASRYSRPDEQGVSMIAFQGKDNEPDELVDVIRTSKIIFENCFLGFDSAKTTYSYESRKLYRIELNAKLDGTDAGYKEARRIFDDCVTLIRQKFGMPKPDSCNLSYIAKSGVTEVSSCVYGTSDGGIAVQLSVTNEKIREIAKNEGRSAIDNPANERMKERVATFNLNSANSAKERNTMISGFVADNTGEEVIKEALRAEENERRAHAEKRLEERRKRAEMISASNAENKRAEDDTHQSRENRKEQLRVLREQLKELKKQQENNEFEQVSTVSNATSSSVSTDPFPECESLESVEIRTAMSTNALRRSRRDLGQSRQQRKLLGNRRRERPLSDREKQQQLNAEIYNDRIAKLEKKKALQEPNIERAYFGGYEFGGMYSTVFPDTATNINTTAQGFTLTSKMVNLHPPILGFTHCNLSFTPYSLLLGSITYYWPIRDKTPAEINESIKATKEKIMTETGAELVEEKFDNETLDIRLMNRPLSFNIFYCNSCVYLSVSHIEFGKIHDNEQHLIGVIDNTK